ncbi:MAG: hypothetical protein ACLTZB_09650 [Streptococcus salivarius]
MLTTATRGMTLADGIEEFTNNTVTSQKTTVTLSGVDGAAEIRKSWINSVAMLLNNSTTQILLRLKTSWNKHYYC